jgi:hypothetical protein
VFTTTPFLGDSVVCYRCSCCPLPSVWSTSMLRGLLNLPVIWPMIPPCVGQCSVSHSPPLVSYAHHTSPYLPDFSPAVIMWRRVPSTLPWQIFLATICEGKINDLCAAKKLATKQCQVVLLIWSVLANIVLTPAV